MRPFPSLEEILNTAEVVSLPMRTRFRSQQHREALLFEGPAGWAEFAPFPEYSAQESAPWLAAGIEAAWQGLGERRRTSIPVNATVPAVPVAEVATVIGRYTDPSALPAVKIKVAEPGQNIDDDVARVRQVAQLLPQAGLRVDANGAWSIPQATRALERIAEVAEGRLEYAEQPVAGVEPLADLREELARQGTPVRIAADEAVRKEEDPLRVAALGAADLIVVKVPPLGGINAVLRIVEASGLDAVVSSALDTSVGLAAGVALAARLPQLPYACGLGTVLLFAHDVVAEPLVPDAGRIAVPEAAPAPVPELLESAKVSAKKQQWWFDRLRGSYEVLSA